MIEKIVDGIKILYEDADILAIEKPEGILTHSVLNNNEKTIADWVLKNYPEIKSVGDRNKYNEISDSNGIIRPGIVHRLDKDTSGVMVLAKNQKAFYNLKEQFQDHTIKKIYLAIVSGWLKNDFGIIDKPIGRSKIPNKRLSGRGVKGKLREAITEYRVLNRFVAIAANKKKERFSLVQISPKTGRTHQIRVHFKYLNHPIIGDRIYNQNGYNIANFNRLALHAYSIELKNSNQKIIKVISPMPFENIKI